MTALIRYEAALLLRSQRWLAPVLAFAMLIVAGASAGQQLGDSLGWCGAMLVPAVGWLTRTLITAEPEPSASVIAAAAGPRQVRIAALTVALATGVLLAIAGGIFEFLASTRPHVAHASTAHTVIDGAATMVVCLLIGTTLGAVCSPPLVRAPAAGVISVLTTALLAVVLPLSPANAAVRGEFTSSSPTASTHLPVVPALAAVLLAVGAWMLCIRAAARMVGE